MQTPAKILVIFILLLTTLSAIGQDIHYSQYFNCPLSLNPAETGIFEGDWRGIVNYRNEWNSVGIPYNTLAASYDQQLSINKMNFSPGFYVISDNSDNAVLLVNSLYASISYHQAYKMNYFSLGIQVGVVFKTVDYSKLTFPDQFNPIDNLFDSPPTSEDEVKSNITYLDFNVGAAWTRKIKNFEPEVGISFFHLNQPNESFYYQSIARVPVRKTFYAALKTEISQSTYIKPGIMLFSIGGSNDMMIGSQVGFTIQDNTLNVSEVSGGVYYRNGIVNGTDAIMAMIGAQIHNLNISVSYDINISPSNSFTNRQGAFEISLIYKNISSILKTFTIPNERI